MKRVTICIATKNRRQVLHQVLWSLRNQVYQWFDVVIVDDGDGDFNEQSWTEDSFYGPLIKELQHQHKVKIISSPKSDKIGAVYQAGLLWAIKEWNNPLFLRCDDDVWLDPNYLEKLVKVFDDPKVGAAGGLMLNPGSDIQTIEAGDEKYQEWGKIDNVATVPNLQWFRHEDVTPFAVEHLHSMQMLTTKALKIIGGFDTALFSNFREETHLSWRVALEGYKCTVVPEAEAWHLKAPDGGVRTGSNTWVDDCRKFSLVKKTLSPGIHMSWTHAPGDVIMLTPMLKELRKKYPDRNITLYHPSAKEILEDNPNIDAIGKNAFDVQRTNRTEESVYGWAARNNWTRHLANAYCRIMGVSEVEDPMPELFGIEPHPDFENYIVIAPHSNAKLYDFSDFSKTKWWDKNKWEELVEYLKETYQCDVIQLSGEEVPEIIEGAWLINDKSLRDAFRVIAGAKCLVSIDTMAQHAAVALGVPTVVMWGRTSPSNYGYQKDNIVNLYRDCPKNHPCYNGALYQQDISQCKFSKHECMDHSIEEVKAAVASIIR